MFETVQLVFRLEASISPGMLDERLGGQLCVNRFFVGLVLTFDTFMLSALGLVDINL